MTTENRPGGQDADHQQGGKLPSKSQIINWLDAHPRASSKRDIAKAFGLRGAEKAELKRLLAELAADGRIERRRRHWRDADRLPPVTVLVLIGSDEAGDLWARPMEWQGEGPEPKVLYLPRKNDTALGPGDRFLARLIAVHDEHHDYDARLMRRVEQPKSDRIVGIFRSLAEGGRILPIDKGAEREWQIRPGATLAAKDGELVEAEPIDTGRRLGLPRARVVERIGDPSAPKAISLIAIHQHGIPDQFPEAVLIEAESAGPVGLKGREDLRDLPLVTIDPADARDHDDAVAAAPDDDPANPDGMILWVAIADVAHYVQPGSAIDREAWKRGNSTYFPDRVVPMLPDALSGDLCSLHEGVERPVIVARMRLNASGDKIGHSFHRAMMRSRAALSYEQAQAAADGHPDDAAAPLLESVITPLWTAFRLLERARKRREPLDLDLPERKIVLTADGRVESVNFRDRLDAHRLIEEFMVLANVAAAEELERLRRPLLYRVHEQPTPERLDALRQVAEASGFTLAKGQVLKTGHLNRLLAQAEGSDFDELINMSTLRSMPQAYYHPANFGHFGLALRSYAHFTSPIRRYADLVVHRALITAHHWGKDGLSTAEIERLEETALHISETERRSMAAERDTNDRYLAAFLAEHVGSEMPGTISGVQRFGAFVRLNETGADGLLPIRDIGREYFHYDSDAQTLMGSETGTMIGIGQKVTVRLTEAVPMTGGLVLELVELDGQPLPAPVKRARGKPVRRKPGMTHARETAAKVKRRRIRGGGS